jgi:hypothetical protein
MHPMLGLARRRLQAKFPAASCRRILRRNRFGFRTVAKTYIRHKVHLRRFQKGRSCHKSMSPLSGDHGNP